MGNRNADTDTTNNDLMFNMQHKIAAVIIVVFAAILTGCSTANSTISPATSDSAPTYAARIIIHRNRHFPLGPYPQFIFDKGNAITYDTILNKSTHLVRGTDGITRLISPHLDAKRIGSVDNGGYLIYERGPGMMTLVISDGVRHLYVRDVNVEAGKAYRVEYNLF